ncbi:NO-inducible flavohemoprotein [Bacillus spongiae]|uniref:Flavohemoprotein n=1 Tax=Bacillus spongiae TaxID=2683610 RepID=A0ABU8H883_9BACI
MLSQDTIAIIKSTVPVLETHGTKITKRFYQIMFDSHPELLDIFNHANQKQGRQQTALANAVYAAAANIDQLEKILPVVKQIGHKHRGLGIKPEQYPIVGSCLLQAIKEVLGDAATDEIINAWGEAYGVIADAFIGVEDEMYKAAEQQKGGWSDFREFYIDQKIKESDVITSFYLKPVDKGDISSFLPGQYITIKVKPKDQKHTQLRQYSLSDAPGKDYYRISVKREDEVGEKAAGVVSNYLHHEANEGDTILLSAPAGDFALDTKKEAPIVLLSGGVGLTPMISMLNTVIEKQPNRDVTFIHAALNSDVHAMAEHVNNIAKQHNNVKKYVAYSDPTTSDRAEKNYDKEGFVTLDTLKDLVHDNQSEFYFCGPVPFMKAIYRNIKELGIPQEQIHYEFFGPAGELEE